ncbi:MAG: hypothetical protein IAE87_16685 [Rhodobacteraceae bacterium]|jgi:hypothetical protein|nr:hypothetical protein [Paracoccaceae bacterium]
MRLILALALVSLFAACGVDGAPQPPTEKPGLTVTGTARFGVAGEL